jgi:DNA-binding transcriptional LysR family regulator
MFELRHLRYFAAVAEELHFGRAAAKLHIAQPPLSQQIRRLEAIVGAQLLERTKRSVALTAAGEAFLRYARSILADAERAQDVARRTQEGAAGTLVVGFMSSAPYTVLPPLLRAYRAAYPGVALEVVQMTIADQLEALDRGRSTPTSMRPPLPDGDVVAATLLREPLIVAMPASHPLARRKSVSGPMLAAEGFVMVTKRRAAMADVVAAFCRRSGFEPRVVQEANEMDTVVGLVSAGLGVTLLPLSACQVRIPDVAFRRLQGAPHVDTALAWKAVGSSPTAAAFVSLAKRTIRRGLANVALPHP